MKENYTTSLLMARLVNISSGMIQVVILLLVMVSHLCRWKIHWYGMALRAYLLVIMVRVENKPQ